MIITYDLVKQSPYCKNLLKNQTLHRNNACYATWLLSEKSNPNSKWKEYLDITPADVSNFPVFFSEEELAELKGSTLLKKIKINVQTLKS